MMKYSNYSNVSFWGDFESKNGPAQCNRMIYSILFGCEYSKEYRNLVDRVFSFFSESKKSETIIISGFSIYTVLSLFLYKKEIVYYCHGLVKYEIQWTKKNLNSMINLAIERMILKKASKIIFVSEMLQQQCLDYYCLNGSKSYVLYSLFDKISQKENQKDDFLIVSTGGDNVQKNNFQILQAIDYLNTKKGFKYKYLIVGNIENQSKFNGYDFVETVGVVPHEDALKVISRAKLFIQNSYFETFGISILEAITEGCNILISKKCGISEVIGNRKEDYLICDTDSLEKIAAKIHEMMVCEVKYSILDYDYLSELQKILEAK